MPSPHRRRLSYIRSHNPYKAINHKHTFQRMRPKLHPLFQNHCCLPLNWNRKLNRRIVMKPSQVLLPMICSLVTLVSQYLFHPSLLWNRRSSPYKLMNQWVVLRAMIPNLPLLTSQRQLCLYLIWSQKMKQHYSTSRRSAFPMMLQSSPL